MKAGFAEVVGTEKHAILTSIAETMKRKKTLPRTSPYGNGDAAEKIIKILCSAKDYSG